MDEIQDITNNCEANSIKTFKLNQFYEGGNAGSDSVVGVTTTLRSGDRNPIEENFPDPSRPTLGPTQPAVQWILSIFSGAWCWPFTPSSAEVKERVDLYLYSPCGNCVTCSRTKVTFTL